MSYSNGILGWSGEVASSETVIVKSDEIVYNRNFEQKLIKMKSLLNLWYPRNLTL